MFTISIQSNSTKEEMQKVIGILQGLMGNGPTETYVEVQQPVTAAEQPAVVEKDSSGLVWDARIHSSSRAKNTNGTWKLRRGTTVEEVAAVKAELAAAPVQPVTPVLQDPAQVFAAPQPTMIPPPPGPIVFGTAPVPVPVPAPVPPAPTGAIMWPEVLKRVVAGRTRGVLSDETITQFLTAHQVESLALMATRQDLFPAFLEHCKV